MNLEWRSIPSWEGYYEASVFGEIRSVERIIKDGNRVRIFKSRLLKPLATNNYGHLNVGLYRNGLGKREVVHRLIAQTFIPNPFEHPIVDHIDGDPTNNHVSNLRWVTYKTNNNNTPYIRYLQAILKENSIHFMSEETYGS